MWMFFLPTVVSLFALSTADECPSGFLRHHDSCYGLVRMKASWAEASIYCSAINGHLAVVESADEHNFLKAHLGQEEPTIDTRGVWLGGLDFQSEGSWMWSYGNGPVVKTWWAAGDPNNDKSGNRGQNCLMMYKDKGFTWDDQYCSQQEFFLCEVERPVNSGVIG